MALFFSAFSSGPIFVEPSPLVPGVPPEPLPRLRHLRRGAAPLRRHPARAPGAGSRLPGAFRAAEEAKGAEVAGLERPAKVL